MSPAQQKFATDYIDVAARIVEFRGKFPDGSLQPADPTTPYRIESIDGQTYIVVVAAAYRSPEDQRPGIGMAYEVFPGKSNFTRGSELQNAETSAWGRAIVASLAADTRQGVASAEEVRNRQAEQSEPRAARQPAPESEADKARAELRAVCQRTGTDMGSVATRFLSDHDEPLRSSQNAEWIRELVAEIGQVAA